MIPNAIISISYAILNWLVSALPLSTGFPQTAHDAMSGLGGYVGIWSPILPMSTVAVLVTLVFSVEIGLFGFKTVKWIISHIPMIGGRG